MGILDKFRLDGKLALVTGCKRGIGKAMAKLQPCGKYKISVV